MTVIVSKPAVNLREELASLRNQGGYQEQQFYFDGLVTNGTFDADTSGWTAFSGASLSIVASQIVCALSGGDSFGAASQSIKTVIGKKYIYSANLIAATSRGEVDISTTMGGSNIVNGSSTGSTGIISGTFTATTTTTWINLGSRDADCSTTWDNVSVFEVDANDDVVHRMPKGWVPKDVYEDGLLQREGSAHDYEVVYDGFDYYVKPTVAPSATTQTCVIGVKA